MPEKEKPQIDKFKEAARELECDDDEQRFKERLGKLVGADDTVPVTLLLEGSAPRLLATVRLACLPCIGDQLEVATHDKRVPVRVTRTQATVKNAGTMFADFDHWACVEPI